MPTSPGLAHHAASLCEVEPALGLAIGFAAAAAIGHRPILPVLSVAPGAWTAPAPEDIGTDTPALAVLEGLLMRHGASHCVFGPGDRLRPWTDESRWVAGTSVRLAALGREFSDSLERWPQAAPWVLARARPAGAGLLAVGPPVERVLDLLWELARRWGTVVGDAIALPPAARRSAIALLLDEPEAQVALALATLRRRGAVISRARGGWLLPGPGSEPGRERGDELRARAALQFAIARMATNEQTVLLEDFEVEHRRHAGPGADQPAPSS